MKIILFWVLSLTWGILMTAVGMITALALIVSGHKPRLFHYLVYFEAGERWGGVNLGAIFIVNKGASPVIKQHEAGHGIQNMMFGIFMPFVVALPSAIRYWYRKWQLKKKTINQLPAYDSIWFEGMATSLGVTYFS